MAAVAAATATAGFTPAMALAMAVFTAAWVGMRTLEFAARVPSVSLASLPAVPPPRFVQDVAAEATSARLLADSRMSSPSATIDTVAVPDRLIADAPLDPPSGVRDSVVPLTV